MHNKDPCLYIQDILEAIARIEQYVEGLTFEEFKKDTKTADAEFLQPCRNATEKPKNTQKNSYHYGTYRPHHISLTETDKC